VKLQVKAVTFHDYGDASVLRYEDVPRPTAGAGEALIRVRACGVNRLDLLVRSGQTPAKPPLPHIGGSEVAGEIEELGPGASGFAPGQRVAIAPYLSDDRCEHCLEGEETTCVRGDILGLISNGGYAEYVKAPITHVLPLPPNVSCLEAAAMTLAAPTAWRMLVEVARVRPGETVLVLAAGSGVGSAAVQIARMLGARVLATAGSAEKRAQALELGADEVLSHADGDFSTAVRRLTGKRGVDVVAEHVGAETWGRSLDCLARNGRLVTCGATTGSNGRVDIAALCAKQLRVLGSHGGTRADLRGVLRALGRGDLRAVIHRRLPLSEAREAQAMLERREQFGKIILEP
jgi:NADPH:quinone reductase-like Zn-dependent oxidoreductase